MQVVDQVLRMDGKKKIVENFGYNSNEVDKDKVILKLASRGII